MTHHITSSTSFLSEEEKDSDFRLNRNDTSLTTPWKTRNSLYLILVTVFEAVVVIVLESFLLVNFNQMFPKDADASKGLAKGIPVYLCIFIFSLVFQIGLAWDAVHNKNTIQIIAFMLFNLCCFIYAVFQFNQIDVALEDTLHGEIDDWALQKLMIANPIMIGICQLVYLYLGLRLSLEFGWSIYKKIGADPYIRNMYRWYQIFLTIIKIDYFFFLGFSIQYLVLVLGKSDAEYALTIAALPVTCLILISAVYAIKHESNVLIGLFFTGLACGAAYFIFKICRIYDPSQIDKYKFVNEFLTFFASVTLFLIILTAINAAICWSNFGKGLKPHLLGKINDVDPHLGKDQVRTLSLD